METIRICPQCREPMAASAPEGLCPQCLLRQAMSSQTVVDSGSGEAPPGRPGSEPPQSLATPKIGEQFGPYRILRLLGRGGMGEVYEADHIETGRRVALKVVSRSLASPEEHARFMREGRLAASISHPHTVYIYGSEEIQGSPVIAMELVGGGTLKDQVKERGPLPVREAVDSILQVITGLEAAHAAGILHRDIKPANCFVASDGLVKVGDFGLSISTLARGETFLTAPGSILGTPAFASPEQLRGEELDVASDIYSVGATLYFVLTGRAPLEAPDLVRLITEVLDRRPESPNKHRPEIPRGLAKVILTTLEKVRTKRFKNYQQLRDALLPFSSAAPTTATLGLRFAAGVFDFGLGWLPEWFFIILTGADTVSTLVASHSLATLAVTSASFLWALLYYGIPEGIWGASLGKALCGLRVVGPDGHTPGIGRAVTRATIFLMLPMLPYFAQVFTKSAEQLTRTLSSGDAGWTDVASFVLLGLLFLTMRRRNGFAGLHELATQTRVVHRPTTELFPLPLSLPKLTASSATPLTNDPPTLGPYQVKERIGPVEQGELWLGYDPVLRREIWLHKVVPGTPALTSNRQNISRAGRLRWLNGRRSTEENWDAYEAPPGVALLKQARHGWHVVRRWLRDLASELYTGIRTQSAVSSVGLDRVWITAHGQAVLLDFAYPLAEREEGTMATPVEVASSQELVTPGHELEILQRFLNRVTASALNPKLPPPLHAFPFLTQLRQQKFPAAELLIGNLESLGTRIAVVSPRRRLAALLAWPALLAGLMVFAMAYDYAAQNRWDRLWAEAYPDLPSFRMALQTYEEIKDDEEDMESLEPLAKLYEIYLAQHFASVIQDPKFWGRPKLSSVFTPRARQLAERALERGSEAQPDERQAAENLVAPAVEGARRSEAADYFWFGVGLFCYLLAVTGILALAATLFFRTNPILRLFGLVAVGNDGQPGGRGRLAWRSLIGWAPIFIASGFLIHTEMTHAVGAPLGWNAAVSELGWSFILGVVLLALTAGAGVVLAWLSPGRGAQDRAAATFVVPR